MELETEDKMKYNHFSTGLCLFPMKQLISRGFEGSYTITEKI